MVHGLWGVALWKNKPLKHNFSHPRHHPTDPIGTNALHRPCQWPMGFREEPGSRTSLDEAKL
jgi:hypothetical protein